jgi:hypothetical protein
MSQERTIASLYARRRRLILGLQDFAHRTEVYRSAIADVEAKLRPLVISVRPLMPRRQCPHFTSREFSRGCQDALREADGKPLTANEIVDFLMRREGMDTSDGALRKAMGRRVRETLRRMRLRGTIGDYARDRCQ